MKDYAINYRRRVLNFPKIERKMYFYMILGVLGFNGVRQFLEYSINVDMHKDWTCPSNMEIYKEYK